MSMTVHKESRSRVWYFCQQHAL